MLLEKEVIFKKDLESIFGKRPFEKDEEIKEEKKPKTEDSSNIENSLKTGE